MGGHWTIPYTCLPDAEPRLAQHPIRREFTYDEALSTSAAVNPAVSPRCQRARKVLVKCFGTELFTVGPSVDFSVYLGLSKRLNLATL